LVVTVVTAIASFAALVAERLETLTAFGDEGVSKCPVPWLCAFVLEGTTRRRGRLTFTVS
jgi:hypothetical protein